MLENESVRAAAGRYNVPRSTLRRYIEKVSNKYSDLFTVSDENLQETIQQVGSYTACAVKQVFSVEQERALVSYAKKYSDHYYGLNITELRELAYQFGKKIQVKYPSKWDEDKMSGRDWYYGFMRRHQELSLRTPEQTTLHRVKSFSEENVQVFFRNLDAVLSEYPYQAADIWNMDETGFSTVPTNIGKVISTRGMRRVGQISAQERGSMIRMALAVSADGNSIPPFFSVR
ncbi:hypothetical protein NQ318_020909 [Aromia moschata]|uniref:HTH psq-type domain-containing protein n=1 Tax=Aromia moschata TaxID=1265417 RepID=A0AAV8XYQ5_9CUCU|nr:hypothetical protein NQ318_020909 [Aromia moschata]